MSSTKPNRLSTGIAGLDTVLHDGLIQGRSYMLHGPAGAGKTILGFHFLEAGLDTDETTLFINLEEDLDDLRTNADTLGFDIEAIEFLDLSPSADVFTSDQSYDVFDAADVEQEPLTETIVERVNAVEPDRVVIDPLTQLHYLTSGEYQFRKQAIGFMRFLKEHGATVVFTVQETGRLPTEDLQYISDGTIELAVTQEGRRVTVPKFRGSATASGNHAYRITDKGISVYPELAISGDSQTSTFETLSSGVPEIDELLNGGLEGGTVSVISGPTGVGKTTLGTQFMKEAAGRGERSVIYLFEENKQTFLTRSEAVNLPVKRMIDRGTLHVEEVEALELSPQEFAANVTHQVEEENTSIIMIDGIAGYRLSLRGDERRTVERLHSLGRYLKSNGVTTVFVDETSDVTGSFHATQENISYLADNIVFLRHLELQGELQKAIGVLKKRTSDYERTLRQFEITEHGIKVGEPLRQLRGVLSGTPEIVQETSPTSDS
ncbi:ATPase domain-containing protein [Natrinema sp. 1APR25-10V2]|uniref:ATPase domain-containing protein n=1 Tax=Natrinema sp. 1APR25-10V2 TaxID=2951081 RepID=UPI0028750491|nr:ATPase domain-containing protein [Natrinema sp. 1APR25-10V2]MDS0477105.1 AAA family ATPase [Natrinema sp. 1APR25-10V2]